MQERPTVGTRDIKVFRTAGSNGLSIRETTFPLDQ